MAKYLRVTTKDRLILQGLLYKSKNKGNKLVLHIHGMAGNFYENRFLDSMAEVFTNNGYAFLTVNTRGHDIIADFPIAGHKEKFKRIGNFREKFEECIYDISAWLDLISMNGYREIILQGHSLGSVKAVYYLAITNDKRVSKLVLASPPDMVGLALAEKDYQAMLEIAKKMISDGKGDDIMPKLLWNWYYLSANTYVNFTEKGNPIDIFSTYDPKRPSILSKITVPTFAFLGSQDDAVNIPQEKALKIIKDKAINCPLFDTTVVNGSPHSYFGHEREVAKMIKDWLEK